VRIMLETHTLIRPTADVLFFLSFVLTLFVYFLLFLFHFPTEFCVPYVLTSGNKSDRLEISTHCAQWSHFAVEHLFRNLT